MAESQERARESETPIRFAKSKPASPIIAAAENRTVLQRYSVAFLSFAFCLFLRLSLSSEVGSQIQYIPFIPAIMVSAWYGGLGPGLLITVCSAIAVVYFFVEPLYSLRIMNQGDLIGLSLFLAVGSLISWLNEVLRRARHEARSELLARTRSEEALQKEQEKLRDSNRRTENILESITDEFSALDSEWRLAYINERALNIIRKAKGEELMREDLVGKNLWELYPELVGSVFYQKYHEALREQKTVHFEGYFPPTNRWVEIHAYTSEDGLSIYSRDITERKRAEEKLRLSEAYLAEAQSVSHTGSWAWNVSTGECFWSLEHFRIFGLDPETFNPTKENTQRLIHSEDVPVVEQTLEKAVRERSDFEVDYRMVRPDGSVRHHRGLGHPVVRETGELEFIGTVMDVTERKQAEEKLRRSEAFLAEGQRISHTGSWAVEFPSEDVFWSQEVFRIYGLDPATTKLSQQMAFQLIHPEDRAFVREAFKRAVRDKSDFAVEHRAILADGSIKHLHALGHPVLNESGELIEYVGMVMDTTDRKQAEVALQKLQAELAHVTRVTTLGELAASIAHEINQPLGAIVNNGNVCLRLVAGGRETHDRVHEALIDIVNDAHRAGAIIARIRALMKRSASEKIPLQLKDVVEGVLALAQREFAERRITVRTELAEDLPYVLGDRVQLQQFLLNLVVNGIEAMHAVSDEQRVMTIGAQVDELNGASAVLVTVRDLGDGFKPEDSERLFDAFYTTKPEGLGMGLWIARSIVEAHGGRLWATLNDGQGAMFSCVLPAAEESE